MRRFIDGNSGQFEWLRDQIQGTLYTFNDVSLPCACTPNSCRMGFEFTPANGYKLYIDKNISFTGSHEEFRQLLDTGEASFESYETLIGFLRGLNILYTNTVPTRRTAFVNFPNEEAATPEEQTAHSEEVLQTARKSVDIDSDELFKGLASKIIGQNKALMNLADATQIHLAQLKPKRPATIFMAGPTGVGKTESVNVLVDTLNEITKVKFQQIRVDCNQFMESHRVAQLLGSPPGYVGYGEPAALAPLADNPRCVVLWDEIEKAHSNVLKAIMSAMDAGKVQLPSPINGVSELDCRYSIFIFTSNLSLKNATKTIGFSGSENNSTFLVSEEDRCKEALVKNDISPEIAGRIAWFLHYEPLTEENIAIVIRLEVEQCANSYGLSVKNISDSIIDELIQSTGSKFGMRAYKQLINRKFGKTFASFKNTTINVTIGGSLEVLDVTPCSD